MTNIKLASYLINLLKGSLDLALDRESMELISAITSASHIAS